MSSGEWVGTTSQRRPIRFTVSAGGQVTSITIGYDFNGCDGLREFLELSVPTKPELHCIPGPCPQLSASYRAFGFTAASPGLAAYTQINGVFLPGHRASGQAIFSNYSDCGSATVQWNATRR